MNAIHLTGQTFTNEIDMVGRLVVVVRAHGLPDVDRVAIQAQRGDEPSLWVVAADISGNGRPDLVVFHIDNPGGDNHSYYPIGWDLDAAGA
jgi:hypothetical protein